MPGFVFPLAEYSLSYLFSLAVNPNEKLWRVQLFQTLKRQLWGWRFANAALDGFWCPPLKSLICDSLTAKRFARPTV
jgi:hypothetical protein